MKITESLCALGLLLSMTLGGCEALKPESRVRLGMTPEEVQALVGPPVSQEWFYRRPDDKPTEVIEVRFIDDRVTRFSRHHEDASGYTTNRSFQEDGGYFGLDYQDDPNGPTIRESYPVSPSEMPVLKGDPPAKVVKLYGLPPSMFQSYRIDPLSGEFENGKLIRWWTTPPGGPIN